MATTAAVSPTKLSAFKDQSQAPTSGPSSLPALAPTWLLLDAPGSKLHVSRLESKLPSASEGFLRCKLSSASGGLLRTSRPSQALRSDSNFISAVSGAQQHSSTASMAESSSTARLITFNGFSPPISLGGGQVHSGPRWPASPSRPSTTAPASHTAAPKFTEASFAHPRRHQAASSTAAPGFHDGFSYPAFTHSGFTCNGLIGARGNSPGSGPPVSMDSRPNSRSPRSDSAAPVIG